MFRAVQNHAVAAARAHIELVVLEAFARAVDACEEGPVKDALGRLCDLHALHQIELDRGYLQEHGRLTGPRCKAVTREVNRLCDEVRGDGGALVDAFGIPDPVLRAPIGLRRSRLIVTDYIDLQRIGELEDLMGADATAIVSSMLGNMTAAIDEVELAMGAGDLDRATSAAHRCRNDALMLGARQLLAALTDLEAATRESDEAGAGTALGRVRLVWPPTRDELAASANPP